MRGRGGPVRYRTVSLQERRQASVARGVASATAVYAATAENADIRDVEGRRYIDFASGIGVLATGHRHPRVLEAVEETAAMLTHTAFQVTPYESYNCIGRAAEHAGARLADRPAVCSSRPAPRRLRMPSRSRASRPVVRR